MKWTRFMLLSGMLIAIITLTGCYTIVTVPGRTVNRVEDENVVAEEEPYEEMDDEIVWDDEGYDTDVVNYYYYGDLWPDYTGFDLYWQSPYWYNYPHWSGWYYGYNPWWDPWDYYYYGHYSWAGYWYYRPWHNRYQHVLYHGPYWTYWDTYYGGGPGRYMEKQPVTER